MFKRATPSEFGVVALPGFRITIRRVLTSLDRWMASKHAPSTLVVISNIQTTGRSPTWLLLFGSFGGNGCRYVVSSGCKGIVTQRTARGSHTWSSRSRWLGGSSFGRRGGSWSRRGLRLDLSFGWLGRTLCSRGRDRGRRRSALGDLGRCGSGRSF